MNDPVFTGWDDFHFMLGSASAGLIGLLFLVMSFMAGMSTDPVKALRATAIYVSPIGIQFAVVLTGCAVALAPRLPVPLKAALFALCALFGFAHAVRTCVGIRARPEGAEAPHWSDFWMYGALPTALYAAFVGASATLFAHARWAIDATAGCMLALLLSGIRNAWDLVTWMAPRKKTGAE